MKLKSSSSGRHGGGHKKHFWQVQVQGMALWLFAAFLAVMSGYAGLTCALFEFMFKTQPTPYLDEVFHIPQAQKYCDGNYTEWDPKITTLPGLYLLSVGFLKPLSWILHKPDLCLSVYALRSVNMIISTGLLYVLYSLRRHLHGYKKEEDVMHGLLTSVNICIFPVLYFFNFLYYTDVASTFLVLLSYLLCLQSRHFTSAVVGLLAVLVRQTNIVWIAFFGLLASAEVLKQHANVGKKMFSPSALHSFKYVELLWTSSLRPAFSSTSAGKVLLSSIFQNLSGYLLVGISFIVFIWTNGGVVVGDKQAHQATIHVAQLLYFCMFVLIFMFPLTLSYYITLRRTLRWRVLSLIIMGALMLVVVHFNTIGHPYLLADNRHYTFYIWRRIIDRNWYSRYVLVPIYMLGAFVIGSILKGTDFIFRVGFVVCVVANLVPQYLLEFRYFIIPYILLRLQIHRLEFWQVSTETGLYFVINALTIILFSMRTITWPNMEEPQRFLW